MIIIKPHRHFKNCFDSTGVQTFYISLQNIFKIGFEKYTHTLSVCFRTSQRLYLVSRREDKMPYSLVCQLILVKVLLTCLCLSCECCFPSLPQIEIRNERDCCLHFQVQQTLWATTQLRSRALLATSTFLQDNSQSLMLFWDDVPMQVWSEE